MRNGRFLVLGACLVVPMVVTGCGSSSSTVDGGQGGTTGAGGAAMDAGVDHGAPVDAADAHGDVADSGGADVSVSDSGDVSVSDSGGSDVSVADTGAGDTGPHDTGSDVSGPCVTSVGPRDRLLFAFNGGANSGWNHFSTSDLVDGGGLTTSIGASFTDGHPCAGALLLAVNFMSYAAPTVHGEAAAIEYYYAASPNGQNWSAYKALHAWIKLQTADPLELAGVYPYVRSGPASSYQGTAAMTSDLTDWHEVIIDLTTGGVPTDVVKFGFEVTLNMSPPPGASPTPSPVYLLIDDIWLEGLIPADAGAGDGSTADAGSGQ